MHLITDAQPTIQNKVAVLVATGLKKKATWVVVNCMILIATLSVLVMLGAASSNTQCL
jgi:hypothetical protein